MPTYILSMSWQKSKETIDNYLQIPRYLRRDCNNKAVSAEEHKP